MYPGWFGVMNVWTLLHPCCAVFRCRDVISTGYQRRDGAVLVPRKAMLARWSAAAKYWFRRTGVAFGNAAANRSGSLTVDDPGGIADPRRCMPLASRDIASGTDGYLKPARLLPGSHTRRDHRIEQAPAPDATLLLRRHKTECPRLSHTEYALFSSQAIKRANANCEATGVIFIDSPGAHPPPSRTRRSYAASEPQRADPRPNRRFFRRRA